MRKKERISRVMLAVTAIILAFYVLASAFRYITLEDVRKIMTGPDEILFHHVQKNYLTGFLYSLEKEGTSPAEWIAGCALKRVPLGNYVNEYEMTDTDIEDQETFQMILARQASDENAVDEKGNLIGNEENVPVASTPAPVVDTAADKLMNYEYLVGNFYTVDSTTMTGPEELNAEKLLGKDMKIQTENTGPKVLIYHTHSQEAFADSVPGDPSTTIMGMGTYLTELLNARGIQTLHHEGVYDLINGKTDRSKAYQLAEKEIPKILQENPTIEVVIDLHRDGVAKTTHLVTNINGKETAQIMFFNGLSRTRANGDISYLKNPYIEDNLAFSLQMQLKALDLYPGFTRRIYLKGYRYNMHFKPKSLLIEAGAQTNTVAEMRNAMELLADVLEHVLAP